MEKVGVVVEDPKLIKTATNSTSKSIVGTYCPICGTAITYDLANLPPQYCPVCGTAPFER